MTDTQKNAYSDRARLAVILAKKVLENDLGEAGRFYDKSMANQGDEQDWGHGLIIQFLDGSQLSWHFAPHDAHLLEGLPSSDIKWDGTYLGRVNSYVKEMNWRSPNVDIPMNDKAQVDMDFSGDTI